MPDHLTPLDAGFLELEDSDPNVSLAIAAIAIIDGPVPDHREFTEFVAARLAAIPHARQCVRTTSLDLRAPVWTDDPDFDLDHHLRRTALPAPGDDEALCALTGRVMAQRVDRAHPLWECWVVEGLAHNRWAVLTKLHHAMADGISGSRLFEALCDPDPDHPRLRQVSVPDFDAHSQHRGLPQALVAVPQRTLHAARATLGAVRASRGLVDILRSVLTPTAPTTLLGAVGRQRRYAVGRATMADIREICLTFDVTVNDVALAIISGALRTVLLRRGEEPRENSVRTLVPVSVRAVDQDRVLGNRVSLMLPTLPVTIADPVDQLAAVHGRMAAHKASGEARAAQLATSFAERWLFAPTAWLVRIASRLPQHGFDIVATNVPGPRRERTLLNRKVVEILPYVPIAWQLRIGIAVLTYADTVAFGVTGDFDTAPDVAVLAQEIERHLSLLLDQARERA